MQYWLADVSSVRDHMRPFVAAGRVPPRTSWAAKLGSLAFKNGFSSEVRNWPSFLVQNPNQVVGVFYFYIHSTPWVIF